MELDDVASAVATYMLVNAWPRTNYKLQCAALGQYNLMGSNLIGLCQSHQSLVPAARHAYHLLVMIEY